MSNYTEHYNLKKPLKTESYDVEVANTNNDIIDEKLYNKVDKISGKSLSSNDFTTEYKKKIDSLQTLYRFKGTVETFEELQQKQDNTLGDVWNCKADNKNYCWNKEEWIDIGIIIDLSSYSSTEEINKLLNNTKTELENKTIVKKTKIKGKTLQEGEPSPDNPVDIRNVGDNINLFDKDNANIIDAYVDINIDVIKATTAKVRTFYVKIKGNKTYTISKIKSEIFCIATTIDVPVIDVAIDNKITNNSATSITLTTNSTANYLVVSFYRGLSDTLTEQEILDSIKIEEGPTATKYSPYNYGTFDLKLQKDEDIQEVTFISKRLHEDDYIDEDGIHYNRKTYVVTGNEDFIKRTTATTDYICIYLNDVINDCVANEYSINVKSNIAKGVEYVNRWKSINVVSCRINTLTFVLDNVTTLEDAKTYFKTQYSNGTPITIEYKLAEEEIEKFDETNQKAFNKLESLLLDDYTVVNSSSSELQAEIELTEYTANEIHRENIEKFNKIDNIDTNLNNKIVELMEIENVFFGTAQELGNTSFNDLMLQGKSSVYAFNGTVNNKADGFPNSAYEYGTIITLNSTHAIVSAYSTIQIYIADIPSNNGIYVRTRKKRKLV